MVRIKTLDDIDVCDKRVLVRVDFNVPMVDGKITNDERVKRALPTIEELLEDRAKVILISHMGRPQGNPLPELSLLSLKGVLNEHLPGVHISFAEDVIGPSAQLAVNSLESGQITVLENLRFEKGEELNDQVLAKRLAEFADIYVNDAFSCAHRAHASIEAIAYRIPSVAGRLMSMEIATLTSIFESKNPPIGAVIGGSKISTKLEVLRNLVTKVDFLAIGGAMANTFLYAKGFGIGKSLCEPSMRSLAVEILTKANEFGCKVILPKDVVLSKRLAKNAKAEIVDIKNVDPDKMILDLGPESVASLGQMFLNCNTILWNGPLGAFEISPFEQGTVEAAKIVAELTRQRLLTSVAGGGDTIAALELAGISEQFSYISLAGGAFLEWLEGKTLPGVNVLQV